MNKLPLGIYTFDKMINGGFLYIDKTKLIYELTQTTEPILFTRPRRFGKTLLLSTISNLFKGQRELFKGLLIDQEQYDWQSYPIIHLDMAKVNCKESRLFRHSLTVSLTKQIKAANLQVKGRTPADILHSFIQDLEKAQGRKVVLLVDGYDLPIGSNAGRPEVLTKVAKELAALYAVAGTAKDKIRFALFTGIHRFDPALLFPGLPNLRDVTLEPNFSALCGFTVAEFDRHFPAYLDVVLSALEPGAVRPGHGQAGQTAGQAVGDAAGEAAGQAAYQALRADILDWYCGYSWDGKTKLLHPFFLLHFFRAKELNNFWHTAKTPPTLVALVRKHDLASHLASSDLTFGPEGNVINYRDVSPVPYLFQNGYLAVSKVTRKGGKTVLGLTLPNYSARWLLFIYMMAKVFNQKAGQLWSEIEQLYKSLKNFNPAVTALSVKRILTSINHGRKDKTVSEHYGRIFLYLMYILGRPLPNREPMDPADPNGDADGTAEIDLSKTLTGLVKVGAETFLVLEARHDKLGGQGFTESPKGKDDDKRDCDLNNDFDDDGEWRYPSKEILALEDRLAVGARASLARLEGLGFVKRLRGEGYRVAPVVVAVHGDSVVNVLFGED
ncbi:MAG: AAA family ATPase [Deltaproteobacteria bacterium]|jgi:hypothetical protein|nr:AAA family ATPase [Deltaproteobacteria bacterium]